MKHFEVRVFNYNCMVPEPLLSKFLVSDAEILYISNRYCTVIERKHLF